MPEITWNKNYWGEDYDWNQHGEEWSEAWGGSEAQWFGTLYPRLHRFLPAENILEIGPGFGRWTKYLLTQLNGHYLGVDLAKKTTTHCAHIFRDHEQAQFLTNDGLDLSCASDSYFNLVFSFDSLVHAEIEVHENYIPQILKKLAITGVAFIHHSNCNQSIDSCKTHARALSVNATKITKLIESHGGHVIIQERVNWGASDALTDAFTLFCRADRPNQTGTIIIDNPHLMDEAQMNRLYKSFYSAQ